MTVDYGSSKLSTGAHLNGEKLDGIVAREADLRYMEAQAVTLRGAVLCDSILAGSDLRWADISNANLRGCDLSYCKLGGSDLSGSTLVGAVLRGAHLVGANLSGADLRNARFNWADMRGANLTHARFDSKTEFPTEIVTAWTMQKADGQ